MSALHHHFKINQTEDAGYVTLPALEEQRGIRHGFTIKGGSERSNPTPLDFTLPRSRRRFLEAVGLPSHDPAMVRQIHGDRILVIREESDRSMLNRSIRADAMISDAGGLVMALLTADCLPLLLFDGEAGAAGIVHAGRRGTLLGIAAKAVHTMREAFGAHPANTLAAFGPAIGPCCYEVGREVAGPFRAKYGWWEKVLRPGKEDRFYLDLFAANRMQLLEAGMRGRNVTEPGLCTSCQNSLFYSYRGEGAIKGHIFSFIMLDE